MGPPVVLRRGRHAPAAAGGTSSRGSVARRPVAPVRAAGLLLLRPRLLPVGAVGRLLLGGPRECRGRLRR